MGQCSGCSVLTGEDKEIVIAVRKHSDEDVDAPVPDPQIQQEVNIVEDKVQSQPSQEEVEE